MTKAAHCQNCGATLSGAFCSQCGQKADVQMLSLGRLLADAFGDLTNFDSRQWRSLATLALKPGRLTRYYIEGRRASYSPPFRMYLVMSLVFFLVFSFDRFTSGAPSAPEADASINAAGASIDDTVNAAVDAALGNAGVTPREPSAVEQAAPADGAPPSVNLTLEDDGRWECNLDNQDLRPRLRARLEAACRKIESDSGASFSRAFADNVPVMMLVFIPIIAAIMKVLYLFARRKYVEHLLFFLHVHTFFFLTGVVTIVVGRVTGLISGLEILGTIVSVVAWCYFPVYLYLAMRHVYAQGRALTAAKYVVLGTGYVFAFILTLFGLLIFTVATL